MTEEGTQDQNVSYRISKRTGVAMVAVAFLFDILPFVLAVIMLFAAFQGTVTEAQGTSWWNVYGHAKNLANEFGSKIGGVLVAGLGILIFMPITYLLASAFSPILAFMVFLFWFLFKRVSPFTLTGSLGMMFEMMPFLNLLPMITLIVWRRVYTSRKEDRAKARA